MPAWCPDPGSPAAGNHRGAVIAADKEDGQPLESRGGGEAAENQWKTGPAPHCPAAWAIPHRGQPPRCPGCHCAAADTRDSWSRVPKASHAHHPSSFRKTKPSCAKVSRRTCASCPLPDLETGTRGPTQRSPLTPPFSQGPDSPLALVGVPTALSPCRRRRSPQTALLRPVG